MHSPRHSMEPQKRLKHSMEPQKGLKDLLWDTLGLKTVVDPDAGQPQPHEASTANLAEVPQQQPDAGADVAAPEPAATIDEHDAAFAAKIASIKNHYTSRAAAARDAQQLLQEAHKQAQRKEAEMLEAADAAYTPAWRHTWLPSKASQLQLDDTALSSSKLLNPAAVVARQQAHQQKEVLQPPAVFAYCDKSAAPHFLQTTGNRKVRQGIAAARITAKPQKQLSSQQRLGIQAGSPRSPQRPHTQAVQRAGQSSRCRQMPPNRTPWSQLSAKEAAARVGQAAARYKAMAAIMTPEQQQIEEKTIKSMYQRLSYLRNPRYAVQQGVAGHGSTAPIGGSTAHKQCRSTQGSRNSTAAQPAQSATRATLTASEAGFSVVPAQGVLYDAYQPGGVYLQTVQLQNLGTHMKQLRLLPPFSRYFQISFPRFPLESSALAPGMCAEVDVCFTPDSLGDYEDSFSVESPAGRFEVQLTGRRPHPDLTLPSVLEVGDVLMGNKRSRTFEFVNKGGDGRFLLLTEQQWAAALQQPGLDSNSAPSDAQAPDPDTCASTAAGQPLESGRTPVHAAALQAQAVDVAGFDGDAPAAVCSGPFSISPAYLDLPAGAAAVVAVEFSPQEKGLQVAGFMLVCDNCTAHPLRVEGYGEQVQVQLVGLDDREWLQQDGQMPLWFGQVCPGANSTRRLRVSNATELPFPFRWMVQSASQAAAFSVRPAAGVLQAKAEQVFVLEFAPQSVAAHSAGLTLSVQRSGDAGLLSIMQWGKDGTAIVDVDPAAVSSTTLKAAAAGHVLQHCSTADDWAGAGVGSEASSDPAAPEGDNRSSTAGQGSWPGSSAWDTVAQLGAEGRGCLIRLAVLPNAAVQVPGLLTVGDQACFPLQLSNDTAAPAHFSIAAASTQGTAAAAAADVCIIPSEGVVPPHEVLQLAAHFIAKAAGRHQQEFVLRVLHGQAQQLHTLVNVEQVKVLPSVPTLDFGVLCVGASASRRLQLHSSAANIRSFWSLRQHDDQTSVPPTVLSFQQSTGWLDPFSACETVVTVTGSCKGPQRLLIRLSSNSNACKSCSSNSNTCSSRIRLCEADARELQPDCSCSVEYVQVLVQVSAPKVALNKYRLPIQHAYTGVPQHHSIVMTNTSSLPLTFNWVIKQLQHQQALRLQAQLQVPQPQPGTSKAGHGPSVGRLQHLAPGQPASDRIEADSELAVLQGAGDTAGKIQLAMKPSTGQLQPGESVRMELQLEPIAEGPVALLCCCQVPAMSQLVGFLVTAQVGGLQVKYRVLRPVEMSAQPQEQPHAGSRAISPSRRSASSPTGRHSKQSSRVGSAASSAAQAGQQQLVQFNSSASAAQHAAHEAAQSAGSAVLSESAQPGSDVLAANFGEVSLHQPAELLLQVTNSTSILSTVRAWMGHFAAQQLSAGTALLGSTAGQSISTWPIAGGIGAYSTQRDATAAVPANNGRARSPLRSVGSQPSDADSRSSSPFSPSLCAQRRQGSPQHKGQLSAAAVAGKLSRTDPCTYIGSRDTSVATPAEALMTTLSAISSHGSMQGCKSGAGSGSSSIVLKGPFRAFAGNAMMAARQAAAAAAAALGSGAFGCAVQLLPDACELPGWGTCTLLLTSFNNLPGSYVDTLFVQVGELPPQQIPVSLQVVGSPLVISKHRVQRQASEVLHTLMQQHHQQLLEPPAQTQAPETAGAAAGCGVASASSSRSSVAISQDSKAACVLDFGIVAAGLQVQKSFYVSNTGALPMQLEWVGAAADKCIITASNSSASASGAAGPEAAHAAPCDAELPTAQGEDADSSHSELASGIDAGSAHSSSTKAGPQAEKAAAGVGKKGVVPAPAATKGAKPASAKQQAQKPVASAGTAPPARISARKEAVSGAEAPAEQQQQQEVPQAEAPALEAAPPAADAAVDGAGSEDASTAAAAPPYSVPDELTVVSCEALLPPGGPSSLLRALQQSSPSTAQPAACFGAGADAVSSAAAEQHIESAASLFSITPQLCVIPAGGQQQFMVSFCSSEARAVQQLVLQGRQSFCQPSVAESQQECGLEVHLLLSQLASRGGGPDAAPVMPVKCCIIGGFHPHAGPPPRLLPALTAALSAVAVAPQLTASDPDCFHWRVTTTHALGTHANHQQTATLCNSTGCPLLFRLAVRGQFELVAAVTSVEQDYDAFRGMLGSDSLPAKAIGKAASAASKRGPADGLLLLPPGEAVDVSIRFTPASLSKEPRCELRMQSAASGSLSSRDTSSTAGSRCSTACPAAEPGPAQSAPAGQMQHNVAMAGSSSHVSENSYTGRYEGALVVAFTTGQQQVVALHADLLQPHLLVSPESKVLDFGGVRAAAMRMLELVITNPTDADAAWTATVQAASAPAPARPPPESAAATFTVSPQQGMLAGHGLSMPKQTRLQVSFAPTCSGPCVAELLLAVRGGKKVAVVLKGLGVHAEQAELRAAYDL